MTPFIGQIQAFGFNFNPRGWAECNGQLLPIAQYTALFSLLGTTYGGDGRTTFGLPEMRGRVMVHAGTGPGLDPRQWGQRGGAYEISLSAVNLPSHQHAINLPVANTEPTVTVAEGAYLTNQEDDTYSSIRTGNPIYGNAIITNNTGGGQPFNNLQPYQVVNVCIALTGLFPSRS